MKLILKREPVEKLVRKAKEKASAAADAAHEGAARVEQKVGDSLAYAKLYREAKELQGEINLQMQTVGEMLYATHKGDPTDSSDIQKILEYADRLHEELAELEKEMKELQGVRICDVCGAENDPGNVYCQDCGQPLSRD